MDTSAPPHRIEEAVEVFGWPGRGRLVITCEHASNRIPPPLAAAPEDLPWLASYWGWDIGARDLALRLAEASGSAAVLSRVCRLACDVNRPPEDPTVFVARTEHHVLTFNELMSDEDRAWRIEAWHLPFHDAVDVLVDQRLPAGGDVLLLSVHTFPPALYGLRRLIEVGILFDPYESIAGRLASDLAARGLATALNEPHSGRRGHMYSAARHGLSRQVVFLELEVNQGLLASPERLDRIASLLAEAVASLRLRDRFRTP